MKYTRTENASANGKTERREVRPPSREPLLKNGIRFANAASGVEFKDSRELAGRDFNFSADSHEKHFSAVRDIKSGETAASYCRSQAAPDAASDVQLFPAIPPPRPWKAYERAASNRTQASRGVIVADKLPDAERAATGPAKTSLAESVVCSQPCKIEPIDAAAITGLMQSGEQVNIANEILKMINRRLREELPCETI